jgi:hypothetical protein
LKVLKVQSEGSRIKRPERLQMGSDGDTVPSGNLRTRKAKSIGGKGMEWFKHYTNAGRNGTIIDIKRHFGMAGVGRYWTILELVAQEMKPGDDRYSVSMSIIDWANLLGTKPKTLIPFLKHLQNVSTMLLECSENIMKMFQEHSKNIPKTLSECSEDILTISVPKLLKLRDSRNNKTPKRGVKDLDKDKETEEEKSNETPPEALEDKKPGPVNIDHESVIAVLAGREMPLSQFYSEKEIPENFEAWGLTKEIPQKFIWKVFKNFYEYFTEVERKRAKNWYMAWQKWVHNDVTNFGRTDNRYTKLEASGKQTTLPNVTDMMAKDPRYADKFATK